MSSDWTAVRYPVAGPTRVSTRDGTSTGVTMGVLTSCTYTPGEMYPVKLGIVNAPPPVPGPSGASRPCSLEAHRSVH